MSLYRGLIPEILFHQGWLPEEVLAVVLQESCQHANCSAKSEPSSGLHLLTYVTLYFPGPRKCASPCRPARDTYICVNYSTGALGFLNTLRLCRTHCGREKNKVSCTQSRWQSRSSSLQRNRQDERCRRNQGWRIGKAEEVVSIA